MAPLGSPVRGDSVAVDDDSPGGTIQKMKDEEMQVGRVQEWWSEGGGPGAAASNPILAAVEAAVLSEVVSAGGSYHLVLTADRLDGLHRRYAGSKDPALEPLQKALQTRGGSKSQARVVGMLLFREARSLYEKYTNGTLPVPSPPVSVQASSTPAQALVQLDEEWSPPRLFVNSSAYPAGAQMAVRSAPNHSSELMVKFPAGAEYRASGRVGEFLQICLELNGAQMKGYALHSMGDTVLLVPLSPEPARKEESQETAENQPPLMDETWSPPRRFVPSDSYPAGAQLAVRAGPSKTSRQLAAMPSDTHYMATGFKGDYLQICVEVDGSSRTAYVPHTLGSMVLLVQAPPETPPSGGGGPFAELAPVAKSKGQGVPETPATPAAKAAIAAAVAAEAATHAAAVESAASGRMAALESKVQEQDRYIQALQAEMVRMRVQLAAIADAFRPLQASP